MSTKIQCIKGRIVDVINRKIFPGEVTIERGQITAVKEVSGDVPDQYIMPGFTDSHIHIESSMLVPSEFAKLAVRHGTVATISDPHEIANVCGMEGVEFMIENGKQVPLKFHFGAPSCVPATTFETAGAELDATDVEKLMQRDDIWYLAEVMNWPGVLNREESLMKKIKAAEKAGKPVDGHAPGLRGDQAKKYADAGISTDHECFTREEAEDKLAAGMTILIREGSAAKNYEALISLFNDHPGRLMFCSDDKHPDDLLRGHINELIARSLKRGYDLFDLLHAACVLPVKHYNIPVGLLQIGDSADFVVVDDLDTIHITQTWIDGMCVYRDGKDFIPDVKWSPINNFTSRETSPEDFILAPDKKLWPVIEAHDGELITGKLTEEMPSENGNVPPDVSRDILKVSVVNRYEKADPAVGFIKNFGLKDGAIASSVAHDSHNIIAVGTSEEYLSRVANMVMENKGGIAAVNRNDELVLPLPVAGIMSNLPGEEVARRYEALNKMAHEMGSRMKAPFMSISFMALLVIPSLKISDLGMFDGDTFSFVE